MESAEFLFKGLALDLLGKLEAQQCPLLSPQHLAASGVYIIPGLSREAIEHHNHVKCDDFPYFKSHSVMQQVTRLVLNDFKILQHEDASTQVSVR